MGVCQQSITKTQMAWVHHQVKMGKPGLLHRAKVGGAQVDLPKLHTACSVLFSTRRQCVSYWCYYHFSDCKIDMSTDQNPFPWHVFSFHLYSEENKAYYTGASPLWQPSWKWVVDTQEARKILTDIWEAICGWTSSQATGIKTLRRKKHWWR